jgi:hypothetical protein
MAKRMGIAEIIMIYHLHFMMISLKLTLPKLRLKRSQHMGRKAVAISLNCCHFTTSAGRNAMKLKPLSMASAAKAIIPTANSWWVKDRLSLKNTKTAKPPQRRAAAKQRIILKVIVIQR